MTTAESFAMDAALGVEYFPGAGIVAGLEEGGLVTVLAAVQLRSRGGHGNGRDVIDIIRRDAGTAVSAVERTDCDARVL